MKNLFICIISLFSLQFIQGQTEPDDVLLKVKNTLFESKLTKFDFTLSIVNFDANIHNEQKGSLIASESKYILDLKDQAKIYFNGVTRWTIVDEDEEIQIASLEEDDEMDISFSKYFEDYKKDYTLEMGKSLVKGETKLLLTPKDKEADTKLIEIQIDMKLYSIKSISEHGKNGTIRNVKIEKCDVLEVNSVSFEPILDNYKSYEIIDMR